MSEIRHSAIDFQIDFIQMPNRMRPWTALSQIPPDKRTEMVHPASDGLIRNLDSTFREQVLDVAQAERKPKVQPDRLANDLGREPGSPRSRFSPSQLTSQHRQILLARAGVTMPSPVPLMLRDSLANGAVQAVRASGRTITVGCIATLYVTCLYAAYRAPEPASPDRQDIEDCATGPFRYSAQ
jgi:hypothetical protein